MPLPADLAATVQEDRVDQDLRVLTGMSPDPDGATIHSRFIRHGDIVLAAAYAEARLEEAGWIVTTEPFSAGGTPCWNIVAELPGSEGPPWIVLGAHYDSTAVQTPDWDPAVDPAPGAEDDGSGVAALLEVARALGAWGPGYTRSIRLALFSAEEEGLYGSTFHVGQHPDDEVAWMGQMDPVGHDAGEMDVFAVYDARWPEAADTLVAAAGDIGSPVRVTPLDAVFLGGDPYSDHAPFWDAGIPAVHISAPENLVVNHSVDDTYALVSVPLVTAVAAVVVAQVAEEAGVNDVPDTGADKPADAVACGCASDGRAGSLGAVALGFLLLLLSGCGGDPHQLPFHPPPKATPVPPTGHGHSLVARAPQEARLERPGRATVAGPGDLTGDGVDDFIVTDRDGGRLDLYAGSAGELVVAQAIPIEGGLQPCRIAPAGDPVGDGLRHVLVQVGMDCDEEDTAVLLFAEGAGGLDPAPIWQALAPDEVQILGRELSAGDIDGDGLDDLVIAQESTADRNTWGGRYQAAVYQGSADGLAEEASWTRSVRRRGQHDGSGASAGGDFNADGYADLIVSDLSVRGSCYTPFASAQAYSGSATGPTPESTWSMPAGGLGLDARLTGDVDGDGFDDALISTTCGGVRMRGSAVVVVRGSPDGLTEPDWQVRDSYQGAYFAYDFDAADVDGDGHLDVLAATTEYQTVDQAHSRGDQKRGMGFVWLGSESGFADCRPIVDDAMRPWPESYLQAPEAGAGIRAIGDVDADGRVDIAVYGAASYVFTNVTFETDCRGP